MDASTVSTPLDSFEALSAITVFCQEAYVGKSALLEDIATLSCVNKYLNDALTTMYSRESDVESASIVSLKAKGINTEKHSQHTVNIVNFVKFITPIQRYVIDRCPKTQSAMHKLLSVYTSRTRRQMYIQIKDLTTKSQVDTIKFYLNTAETFSCEMRAIYTYMLYDFLDAMCKHNDKQFLANRKLCVLGFRRFRKVVIEKANELTASIREQSLNLPYGFLEKEIRLLGKVRRYVSSL